jgi:hypothetical protein
MMENVLFAEITTEEQITEKQTWLALSFHTL